MVDDGSVQVLQPDHAEISRIFLGLNKCLGVVRTFELYAAVQFVFRWMRKRRIRVFLACLGSFRPVSARFDRLWLLAAGWGYG